MYNHIVPFSSQPVSRTLIAAGLWIRLSLASMFVAGAALAGLVQGALGAAPALAAIAGGAVVAVLAWRRAVAALDGTDTEAEPRRTLASGRLDLPGTVS